MIIQLKRYDNGKVKFYIINNGLTLETRSCIKDLSYNVKNHLVDIDVKFDDKLFYTVNNIHSSVKVRDQEYYNEHYKFQTSTIFIIGNEDYELKRHS